MGVIVKDGAFVQGADLNLFEVSRDMSLGDLSELAERVQGFVIPFEVFKDGWGFSIAQSLRNQGFEGHLRAKGPIVADQYPLALRSGFDDMDIDEEIAERGGEAPWRRAFEQSKNRTYSQRLREKI